MGIEKKKGNKEQRGIFSNDEFTTGSQIKGSQVDQVGDFDVENHNHQLKDLET